MSKRTQKVDPKQGFGGIYYKIETALKKEPGGLTFTKLAMAANVTPSQLSGALPGLESSNLLKKDRRTRRYILCFS